MKTNDLLLYGALAYLGYKFFIAPQTTVTTVATPVTAVPGSTATSAANITNLTALGTGAASLIAKLFPSSSGSSAATATQSAGTNPLGLTIPTLVAAPAPAASTTDFSSPALNLNPSASVSSPNSLFTTPSFASAIETAPAGTVYTSDTDYLMSIEDQEGEG